MTRYDEGVFCWTELGSAQTDKSQTFYTNLFPWTVQVSPFEDNRTYTVFQSEGFDVAAMYTLDVPTMPAFWGCYIAVRDVEASAEKAAGMGAEILSGPRNVSDKGRLCVFRDPTGAAVALWEAGEHIGSAVIHDPYSVDWHELYTTDLSKASDFYTGLLGWTKEVISTPQGPYLQFKAGNDYVAGMRQLPAELLGMPSGWGIYFKVPNCDDTVRQAEDLGAKVIVPPHSVPNSVRFATLVDPQGAIFSVQSGI